MNVFYFMLYLRTLTVAQINPSALELDIYSLARHLYKM